MRLVFDNWSRFMPERRAAHVISDMVAEAESKLVVIERYHKTVQQEGSSRVKFDSLPIPF